MGEADIVKLSEIYRHLTDYCRSRNIHYKFSIDHGDYETAIQFKLDGEYHAHPPWSEDWSTNPDIKCPDIMDYDNLIIIEYEEETGNRRLGAKYAKKGHGHPGDLQNKHDETRFKLFKKGKFRVFRLWGSNENWKHDIRKFINTCVKEDNSKSS